MTSKTIHVLRSSFARVEALGHVAALIFYKRLFELAPQLRPMFPGAIEEQSKKLIDILSSAVGMLERPEDLRVALEQLGARHAGYGVKTEHYDVVGTALVDMLASVLAENFTPPVRAAWTGLYETIESTMLSGSARQNAAKPSAA